MDQAHTRAITALQPFMHLALSTANPSPRFLADLITRVTSAPNAFVFAELLQTPAIQSLRSTEYATHLTQLEVFAWGTLEEYQSASPALPPLNDEQSQKLRQLSLLSLATSLPSLTYSSLMSSLSLSNPIALESLVTSAIYSSLLTARLSPATTPPVIHITSVSPLRDLRPASLPQMLKTLGEWESRCTDVIGDIEAQIAAIRSEAAKRSQKEKSRMEIVERAVAEDPAEKNKPAKKAEDGKKGGGTGGGKVLGSMSGNKRASDDNDEEAEDDANGDGMDVDEVPGGASGSTATPLPGGNSAKGLGRNVKRALGMGKKGS